MSQILIAHGGVDVPLTTEYQSTVERAALAGFARVCTGLLTAIETSINVMEDAVAFNAGFGSVLNRDGEIEMDALIIDGQSGRAGAVAAIQNVAHPISVARRVLQATPYVLLAGHGATLFAHEQGFPPVSCESPLQRSAWERMQNSGSWETTGINPFTGQPGPQRASDTVGCVVCSDGDMAAGVSTGGLFFKAPGRVGDSAIVGAGAFASRTCAVAGTGLGEAFHELLLTRRVAQLIETGVHPQIAVEEAIAFLAEQRAGVGGLIAVDRFGRYGAAHNGESLAMAIVVDGKPVAHPPAIVESLNVTGIESSAHITEQKRPVGL